MNEPDPAWDEMELDRQLEASDDQLRHQLRELLVPEGDLGGRTATDVERRLRSRSVAAASFELLGVGWWTARALLSDDPRPADRDHEGI